ncbi:Non-specific serine/threonine protein kinase [Bertholletia excelsa]
MYLPWILLLQLIILIDADDVLPQTLSACQDHCGNVTIPFPFGTSQGCYLDEQFLVTCNHTHYNPPKLFLNNSTMEVTYISLSGWLRRAAGISRGCYSQDRTRAATSNNYHMKRAGFTISYSQKLTAIGCDTSAVIVGTRRGKTFATGCISTCDGVYEVINGTCSGVGCCQSSIPSDVWDFNINLTSYANHTSIWKDNPCSYTFVAEDVGYNFSSLDLLDFQKRSSVPMVLDWNVKTCACANTDECATSNPCSHICENFQGGYSCSCPEGYQGDGYKNGVCLVIGALLFLICTWSLCQVRINRRKSKRRGKFFKQNGGLMLQQLSSRDGNVENTKVLNSRELEKATDYYNENRILGQGGQGTIYKGMLSDRRIIAVDQFINEVTILSQINHRNIVKLLGCCLETVFPLLVYEFIPNGTLFQHIHYPNEEFLLTWAVRIRIARALSYLHNVASIPIYHRDIKSSNILLDDKYRAKISDFGISRSIGIDQTHLTTIVKGTFGYFDPEYFQSGKFTEGSDVYSFGVVTVELLTGQKVIPSSKSEECRGLATFFIEVMAENRLVEILDPRIREGPIEEVMATAQLVKKCLDFNGKKRPTMNEVAVELEVDSFQLEVSLNIRK